MHIQSIFSRHSVSFSFEFFPPKTVQSSSALFDSILNLVPLKPAYVSVTYGAGGSTRELTHDLVVRIQKETDVTVISHLTCIGATRKEIGTILTHYQESGIENIFALRGDPPIGETTFTPIKGGFAHAAELVKYIRDNFPSFGIGVAGYPEGHCETPNRLLEMDYLKEKVDNGADYICTQMFFDNRDYYDFCDRCRLAGIKVPIIAGIMPITSLKGMKRMASLAAGVRYPAKLIKALQRAKDDASVEKVGVHWATQQVMELLDRDIKGVHFYTLNKSGATQQIYETLGVSDSDRLEGKPY